MKTVVKFTQQQAVTLTKALGPLVKAVMQPADLEDRRRTADMVKAGTMRLHCSLLITNGPMEFAIFEVDPEGVREPVLLGTTELDGGGLLTVPADAQFN